MQSDLTYDELLAERDYWRSEAQRNATADQVEGLRCAFGLTVGEAWILGRLYGAGGKVVRHDRLVEDMPGRSWDDRSETSNTQQVFVHRIRKKLPEGAILSVPTQGYRLSDAGLEACRAACG